MKRLLNVIVTRKIKKRKPLSGRKYRYKVMTIQEKKQIKEALRAYCEQMGSQNMAARSLKKVSSATISEVLNDNWDLISDDKWRTIAAQIGYSSDDWKVFPTKGFQLLTGLLADAKEHSNVFGIVADAGTGKTEAMKTFRRMNSNSVHMCCNEFWNRKLFLSELLQQLGRSPGGYTVGEMMQEVVSTLKQLDKPLIMLDEADKLTDNVLYFFITLYNQLEGNCGIILCATSHLQRKIKRGLRLNKKGYSEIYSRLGRKFITIKPATLADIGQICIANGIDSKEQIDKIKEEAKNNEFDLRRIKRVVHMFKQLSKTN